MGKICITRYTLMISSYLFISPQKFEIMKMILDLPHNSSKNIYGNELSKDKSHEEEDAAIRLAQK